MLLLNYDDGKVQDFLWSAISSSSIWILPALFFMAYIFRERHWRDAIVILLCLTLTVVLCDQISSNLIKPMFMRLRPSHDASIQGMLHYVGNYRGGMYGFVSSHATNAFGAVTFISGIIRSKRICHCLMVFASCVCYSRVYLGVHYPGDVVCGAILGMLIGFCIYKVYAYFTSSSFVFCLPKTW